MLVKWDQGYKTCYLDRASVGIPSIFSKQPSESLDFGRRHRVIETDRNDLWQLKTTEIAWWVSGRAGTVRQSTGFRCTLLCLTGWGEVQNRQEED